MKDYPRYFLLVEPEKVIMGDIILYIYFKEKNSQGRIFHKDRTNDGKNFISLKYMEFMVSIGTYKEIAPQELVLI